MSSVLYDILDFFGILSNMLYSVCVADIRAGDIFYSSDKALSSSLVLFFNTRSILNMKANVAIRKEP